MLTELRISQKAWDYALICVKGDIIPEAKMHLLAANIQDILDIEAVTLPPRPRRRRWRLVDHGK